MPKEKQSAAPWRHAKRVVVALVLLLAVLPLLIRGADDAGLGSLARGITHVVVGDGYIGCLEMRFSRCFADPTLACVEDAMVECSLEAAAAPAATTTGPAAPLAGGGAAAELVLGAIGGIIVRGIATAGAKYINCVEVDLVKCYLDPTIECVEKAIGAC
jgi:hypothetical protein